MGHIRDRWRDPARRGKGKRWQVKYQVDGRERDGGAYDTKVIAQRKLVELESAVNRGQWVDPTDDTTVTELVRAYVATRRHKRRTAERVESDIVNHIEATAIGTRRVAALKPSELQGWVTDRSAVLAPRTVRNLAGLLRSALNAAVLDRVIPASPFIKITLPRVERERIVPLTVDQVAALHDEIGARYRAMVLTQAGLGLRIGELLALRVQDVDFLRRTARVEHQIERDTRARVEPKTPRSRRTLPLPDMVAQALAEHLRQFDPAADGLLFHTASGLPIDHDWYANKVFARTVARVRERIAEATAEARRTGKDAPAALPTHVTTHDLRHHFASLLLASGSGPVAVAELLGHENATLVLTTYGHLMPGSEEVARKAIDAAWTTSRGAAAQAPTARALPGGS
ncbi:site-specific integrase [Pseudonocardia sp. ICBG601]|uniref:tyrosine-type recombinase/integrase n=1 Tax=Pseudonocardia sp. ICBG601 TaxID=2846759 RepID=UPI001CF6DB0A|nr:site-specific integrase [Pseudonocardia sp. ICBG601]